MPLGFNTIFLTQIHIEQAQVLRNGKIARQTVEDEMLSVLSEKRGGS